jgi:hypothetical protein
MTSIGAYYVFVVSTEMKRDELARQAADAPKRSLADRARALAAFIARRPAGMAVRPI